MLFYSFVSAENNGCVYTEKFFACDFYNDEVILIILVISF